MADKGDRIVQIVLLLLIAAGMGCIVFLNIGNDKNAGGSRPGGAPAGRPSSGGVPAAQTTAQTAEPSAGGQSGKSPGSGPGASAGTNRVTVEAYTVAASDVSQYIRVNGDVTVETSVDIYSDTAGKLVNRSIDPGDSIKKNQPLITVDPSLPGQNYSLSTVRSTIAGTVLTVPVQEGDKITTSSPIATIGNLNNLIIESYIPEKFIANLEEGLTAELRLDAFPGELFSGEVIEMNPVMDTSTRTLEIKLKILNQDSRIRPGMFASMKLITQESLNTIAVPSRAVLSYYGEPAIYVINKKGEAERRIVTTGLSSDENIEILEGLKPGEIVITQGLNKLTDGTAVKTISLEADA